MRIFAAIPVFIFLFYCTGLKAQPYVDPLNIRYTHAFKSDRSNAVPFSHLYIGSDIPVKFKNGTLLLLSPFFENWNIDSAGNKNFLPEVSSVAFPVGVIFPLNNKWSFNITAIPRI